jgi:hypothetical protein
LLEREESKDFHQEHHKPKDQENPKIEPLFLTDLGGESKRKEPRRVHACIPHEIPKRKVSKPPQEIRQEKAPKITKKEKREEHDQGLSNHAKSSTHTTKVHA